MSKFSLFVNVISVFRGCHDLIVVGLTTIHAINAFHPYIVSLNSAHREVYSKQRYAIKFVSDLRQVVGFLWVFRFPLIDKTDLHDITEILFKVTLKTLAITLSTHLFMAG